MSAALRYQDDAFDHLSVSVRELLEQTEKFTKTMPPRDQMLVHLGLESAHAEEAIAQGDLARAEIHLTTLSKIVGALGLR